MNTVELVKTRRSVRTFDGRKLTEEDKGRICSFIETIRNPYDIPVEFVLLDAKEYGLSSPVLVRDTLYVAAKVEKKPHAEEAFGFSFEKLVLYAWSIGIGTTWIGGTLKRQMFENAAEVKNNEWMFCVSPLGYPAKKMSIKEIAMRKGIKADERKPAAKLFFDRNFYTPLTVENKKIEDVLEMVRLAPSATNKQPWRIVRDGDAYHFYLKHDKGYASESSGDVQKVDMGIALCHFLSGIEGEFLLTNPGIATDEDTEYIATIIV